MTAARSEPRIAVVPAELIATLVRQVLEETVCDISFQSDISLLVERWLESEQASDLARLPELTCQAAGGDAHQAKPATAAWQLVRLAAKLLDDVEDGDVTSQRGATVNMATALLFITQLMLDKLSLPLDHIKRVGYELQRAILRAAAGQHADLCASTGTLAILDPASWLAIARAKSGELVGWAAWAGACVATASDHALGAFHEYGTRLGVLLQIADDFNGVWNPRGSSDLANGSTSLAVCYARSITHGSEREHLDQALYAAALGDSGAMNAAQRLLTGLGALNYIIVAARTQCAQACQAIDRAAQPSPAHDRLNALANEMLCFQNNQSEHSCITS